ncbi:MAG: hypothetical protein KAS32_20160 [Candidatus Peribacteraceae bacterium]|nr:hypothetical protein [Candidatus Peribacteraceae bacterium]
MKKSLYLYIFISLFLASFAFAGPEIGGEGGGGGGGASTFIGLSDTPANYTAAALKHVRVNAGGTGLEYVAAAGGATVLWIPAGAMIPTATNGAQAGTNEYVTNDINIDYYAFDDTTEEFVEFDVVWGTEWDLGTITATFYWSSATGSTAGDTVEWELQCGALSDDDAIDAALGTAQVITDTLLANSGADLQISSSTPSITVGGTPANNDLIHCKASRNVGGTDDMVEDAWLMGAYITW